MWGSRPDSSSGAAALPVLTLALGLVAPGRSAAQAPPPAPARPRGPGVRRRLGARDLPAVLALFAPDAMVRERWGAVPADVWDTRDPRVARAYLEDSHDGDHYDTHGFVWATGRPQIAAWRRRTSRGTTASCRTRPAPPGTR